MISVRLEDPADFLALERGTKLVSVEEFVCESRRYKKLIAVFSEAASAQTRGVVRCQRRSAALTPSFVAGRLPPLTGESHSDPSRRMLTLCLTSHCTRASRTPG
jgi:hypothetical protein